MKTLFITATFFEAKALLSLSQWEKKHRNLFEKEENLLLITGIGWKNILKAIPIINQWNIKKAVNIGICAGVLNFQIGGIFFPKLILTEEELQNNNIFSLPTLISLKSPMKSAEDLISQSPELRNCPVVGADMEAAFLKHYFDSKKIPMEIIKVFSDSGEKDFIQNFSQRKIFFLSSLMNVVKKQYL